MVLPNAVVGTKPVNQSINHAINHLGMSMFEVQNYFCYDDTVYNNNAT